MQEIDLKKLDVAIKYTERMANGRNPVSNQSAPGDSVIHDPNVIRCLFFIKDVLQQVQNNGGKISGRSSKVKTDFPIEKLSNFSYQQDQSISHFLNQLKSLCDDPKTVKLSTKPITDWLKQKGYLQEIFDKYTGEKKTVTTPEGEAFGLYMEERTSSLGRQYNIIIYSRTAQEQIVANFNEIISEHYQR